MERREQIRESRWDAAGRQLANPSGVAGWIMGGIMRLANRAPIRMAIDALALQPTDIALDLGCGPGAGIAALAKVCTGVHGVDRSPTMVRAALRLNRRAVAAGIVQIVQGDFACLPLADASVDKVLAANVLYFWDDAPAIIAEIGRVLRPGGRLVLYVTDRHAMQRWKFASNATHRHFDSASLRETLVAGGIPPEDVAIRAVNFTGVGGWLATCALNGSAPAALTMRPKIGPTTAVSVT